MSTFFKEAAGMIKENYSGIWIFAEQRGGVLSSTAFELIAKAQELKAHNVEFIIGEMGRTGDAAPHTHHGFDQLMFILEGQLRITSPATGKEDVFVPGDLVIFPDGVEHKVVVESEHAKFCVLYGPPKQHMGPDGNWIT